MLLSVRTRARRGGKWGRLAFGLQPHVASWTLEAGGGIERLPNGGGSKCALTHVLTFPPTHAVEIARACRRNEKDLRDESLRKDSSKRAVLVPVERDKDGNVLDGHHRKERAEEPGRHDPTIVRRCGSEHEEVGTWDQGANRTEGLGPGAVGTAVCEIAGSLEREARAGSAKRQSNIRHCGRSCGRPLRNG